MGDHTILVSEADLRNAVELADLKPEDAGLSPEPKPEESPADDTKKDSDGPDEEIAKITDDKPEENCDKKPEEYSDDIKRMETPSVPHEKDTDTEMMETMMRFRNIVQSVKGEEGMAGTSGCGSSTQEDDAPRESVYERIMNARKARRTSCDHTSRQKALLSMYAQWAEDPVRDNNRRNTITSSGKCSPSGNNKYVKNKKSTAGKIADKIFKRKKSNRVTPDSSNDMNASETDLKKIDSLAAKFDDKLKMIDTANDEMIDIDKEFVKTFVNKWRMTAAK